MDRDGVINSSKHSGDGLNNGSPRDGLWADIPPAASVQTDVCGKVNVASMLCYEILRQAAA